ncbi:hypothetical protein OKW22_001002 [Bacilli bacterium PM5-3]|nr:hypothetical protein [Bacilli bacterium PM5-3]MDH6604229.1 hypothetical protein [Bacilli bacterium PM5-9]
MKKIIMILLIYLLCMFTTTYLKIKIIDYLWIALAFIALIYYIHNLKIKMINFAKKQKECEAQFNE